ncbi:MAG: DUF2029 domain-containing protein [Planctomycetia bacterium]|nr:DUF2029 domain-containing protein [Planctomycetia bacterium]
MASSMESNCPTLNGPTIDGPAIERASVARASLEAAASDWPTTRRFVWACLLVLSCFAYGPGFYRGLVEPGKNFADFFQEWASARNYFTGRPIYTPQREAAQLYLKVTPSREEFFVEINGHPPSAVLLALPFGVLTYGFGFLLWNWLSVAALGTSAWLILRETGIRFSRWAWLPALTLATGNPVLQHLGCGQLGAFLLLLITATWIADRRGYVALAGAILAVATAVKLFPGFLFLYFVLKGKWRAVFVGAFVFVLTIALTAVVLGPQAFESYITKSLPEVSTYRASWANTSLDGFCLRLFSADSKYAVPLVRSVWLPRVAYLLAVAILIGVVAFVTRRSRTRETEDMAFGLHLIALVLVSPICWDHYFVLLMQPILLIAYRLGRPSPLRGMFRLSLAVLWLNPLFLWTIVMGANSRNIFNLTASLGQNITIVSLPVYAACALFLVAAVVTETASDEPEYATAPIAA